MHRSVAGTSNSFRVSLLFIFSLFGFLLFAPPIQAQEPEEWMISPKGDTIPIEAIPVLEINTRLEGLRNQMNQFEVVLRPDKEIFKLDTLFREVDTLLNNEESELEDFKRFQTISSVDDSKRLWKRYDNIVKEWSSQVSKRIEELDATVFSIQRLERTWEKTEIAAREENLPQESILRIQSINADLLLLEQNFITRRDSTLLFQNQITDLEIRINDVLNFLKRRRIELQTAIFIKDSPALWNAFDSTAQVDSISVRAKGSIQDYQNEIAIFFQNNRESGYWQIVLTLLYLALFYYLRFEYFRKISKEELQKDWAETIILRYAWASALFLGFVSSIFLYPSFPGSVSELVSIFLLIPAIFLLHHLSRGYIRSMFYALLVLFIIDELQLLFIHKSLFSRILYIFENLFLIWMIWHYTRKSSPLIAALSENLRNLVAFFKPIYIIVAAGAVITNLIGYVNLAFIITNTIIGSVLVIVLLYLLVLVLETFFREILVLKVLQYSLIIRNRRKKIFRWWSRFFIYLAVFIFIRNILNSLGIREITAEWLIGLVKTKWELESVTISVGGILAFFLVIVITWVVTRMIRVFLEEEIFPRIKLARGVPGAISMLVSYTLVAFGIYIALSAAGIDLGKFGLIAGALGVGIGFGLQGVVNNFIAGLILAFERPIQKGDTIEVGTLLGDVTKIGVRASTVKTYDGSEVIVPNGNLISNEVINWTLSNRRRRRVVPVSVAYGSKPREVMEILYKTAEAHPEVLDFPKPWPLFDGFGDSALNFRVLFWVDFDRGLTVTSEVAMNIYDALEDAGIQIPFPQQDLHVKSFDPTLQKTVFPWTRPEKGEDDEGK